MAVSGDPIDFLSWLMNTLHKALGGTKKADSSESWAVYQYVYYSILQYITVYYSILQCTTVYLGKAKLICGTVGSVYKVFQGGMKIYTRKLPPTTDVS